MTLPAEFLRLIDDQARAGVDVQVAYVDRLPENLVEDFALWDDKLVARVSWKPRPVVAPNGEKRATTPGASKRRDRKHRNRSPLPGRRGEQRGAVLPVPGPISTICPAGWSLRNAAADLTSSAPTTLA